MVSGKCMDVLRNKPRCDDNKLKKRWLMCYARKKVEDGLDFSTAMKEAWRQVRSVCSL